MTNSSLLDNISIVLVDTKTPANIGATARCMMNMGLNRLLLVNPPKDPDRSAFKLAAGADDILNKAATFPSLADALADHGYSIAASRHTGRKRKNISTPRDMAQTALSLLAQNRVAIVFGNEVNGLEDKDVALCNEITVIPAADAFPSLNLSHAVMIIAYELHLASTAHLPASEGAPLARIDDLERFYTHLQATLREIGFLEQDHPERMVFSLRQIFGRARLSSRDVGILQGVLSSMDRAARAGNRDR